VRSREGSDWCFGSLSFLVTQQHKTIFIQKDEKEEKYVESNDRKQLE
jgi:hypothetical protein